MATPAQQATAFKVRQSKFATRLNWFDKQVATNIKIGMQGRLKLAGQMLRDKVVINISRPVTKVKSNRTGRTVVVPSSRSKPGEFPKADTTRLMKDIFWEMRGPTSVIVGTTLDYGLILETRRNRSFLKRTHDEMLPVLRRVITSNRGGKLPGQST